MDSQKIEAIMSWETPNRIEELHSFLGLANYHQKFIKGYSKIAVPLTILLRKDQEWVYAVPCMKAFDKLKSVVVEEPILKLPNFEQLFEARTDTSD